MVGERHGSGILPEEALGQGCEAEGVRSQLNFVGWGKHVRSCQRHRQVLRQSGQAVQYQAHLHLLRDIRFNPIGFSDT